MRYLQQRLKLWVTTFWNSVCQSLKFYTYNVLAISIEPLPTNLKVPKKICCKLKTRYEQTLRQSEEVSQSMGTSERLCACLESCMNIHTLPVSFMSLFLKQRRAVIFSGPRNLVCLSSFIEQMLKQNNISSQGFSIMYLSRFFASQSKELSGSSSVSWWHCCISG